MKFTTEEKEYMKKASEFFQKHGCVGLAYEPDGSVEIAPGYYVKKERAEELVEIAI